MIPALLRLLLVLCLVWGTSACAKSQPPVDVRAPSVAGQLGASFESDSMQLRIIAKASLARFPVLGWHLRRGGHLFVDRRHPDPSGILRRWRALVSEGLSLLIYAEGTRSPDGHVGRFKAGSFLLAIQAGLPIVPISVIGTRTSMPKGRLQTEPADVTLIIHDPIQPPVLDAPTPRDAKALASRVHAIVSTTVERRQFHAV